MKFLNRRAGFTIVELLTVMSIIVVLIALLVPSLNAVRRYSKVVRQKGQFHDIGTGLEMFSIDFDGYPDSKWNDVDGARYCGAMKLCEAMMGQDGLGFHPDSRFCLNGLDKNGKDLYPDPVTPANQRERKHTYIDTDKHKRAVLQDIYPDIDPFVAPDTGTGRLSVLSVLCDVFGKVKGQITGERMGMAILYYKADVTKFDNDPNVSNLGNNIYNINDNFELTGLMAPGATEKHPLHDGIEDLVPKTAPDVFYGNIRNKRITAASKPNNENTFILLSAGWDGLYGTKDDIYNFVE
jgi:prepilin-type N-terminal cleavage/methylation domain-containing protein